MNSTNTVVANAIAARNAAPKGLTPTTKLRLKEDFSDKYGSYRKGDVFPMYAMGGVSPKYGTMVVPGRMTTLQIPWEKLEVVNAAARNANDWIDDPKKKKAMDEIDKKADALYRQLKDIARKFDALKNEQVKVGFYFADYSDAARQIREIHGME